jgi:hypothetical protein
MDVAASLPFTPAAPIERRFPVAALFIYHNSGGLYRRASRCKKQNLLFIYQQSFDYAAALLCNRVSGATLPAAKTSNSGSDVPLSHMVAAAAGCYGSIVDI